MKEFDLIILCLGGNSIIYAKISKGNQLKDYKEIAVTGYVSHKIKKINTLKSIFFEKMESIAILPF